MKFISSILMSFCFFTTCACYGQKAKGELIPLLLHSYKIDSLLNRLVDMSGSIVSKDSIFSINVEKNNRVTFISIESYDKKEINLKMSAAHFSNQHLGYFMSNGFLVFVRSSEEFEDLFTETKILKLFKFFSFSSNFNSKSPLIAPNVTYFAEFFYQNGKFISTNGDR